MLSEFYSHVDGSFFLIVERVLGESCRAEEEEGFGEMELMIERYYFLDYVFGLIILFCQHA